MYKEFTWKGATNNQEGLMQVTGTANQSGNYSDVTVRFYARTLSTSPSYNYDRSSFYIVIDGSRTDRTSGLSIAGSGWTSVHSQTKRVSHNADGSKTINVQSGGSLPGTSYNLGNYSINVTLDKITRAFTASYNANGGSGAPSPQTKQYGVTLKLSGVSPTRTGYNFLGWSSSPPGVSGHGSVSYYPGSSYTNNSNITLYAVWEQISCIITFDGNGGISSQTTRTVMYGLRLGELPTATRKNYKFLGWTYNKDGSGNYIPDNLIVTYSFVAYAQYEMIANCYVKEEKYIPGMMYNKNINYVTGELLVKVNGQYKNSVV